MSLKAACPLTNESLPLGKYFTNYPFYLNSRVIRPAASHHPPRSTSGSSRHPSSVGIPKGISRPTPGWEKNGQREESKQEAAWLGITRESSLQWEDPFFMPREHRQERTITFLASSTLDSDSTLEGNLYQ